MGDLKQKLRNKKKLVILLSVVSILIIVVIIIYNLQFTILNVYMKVIITVQRKYTALIKIMKILKTI